MGGEHASSVGQENDRAGPDGPIPLCHHRVEQEFDAPSAAGWEGNPAIASLNGPPKPRPEPTQP